MAGKKRAPKRDDKVLEVPTRFLRDLTSELARHVIGRGAKGRKNEIAVSMAELLQRHKLEGLAHIGVAQVVGEALADELTGPTLGRHKSTRREFSFDADSGALCWSPSVVAEMLGVSREQLCEWRQVGAGPRFIKLTDAPQGRVVYPIEAVREWLDAREKFTAEHYATEDAA